MEFRTELRRITAAEYTDRGELSIDQDDNKNECISDPIALLQQLQDVQLQVVRA